MDPVIDFAEEPVKEEPAIERKPVIVYKPEFVPIRATDSSPSDFRIKKKWLLYFLVILSLAGVGLAGFLLGKYF